MLKSGIVHTARAEDVYPTLEPGSVSMVWSDGPYGVRIAEWDRMKPADLPAWYEPHIREWSRICAPSATIYHWGTAEGEGYVRKVYRRHGWTFRGCITWDKGIATLAGRLDTEAMRMWPDVTEVCGFWQREGWDPALMKRWLRENGIPPSAFDEACGVSCVATRKYLGEDWQAYPPTDEDLAKLRAAFPAAPMLLPSSVRAPFTPPPGVTNVWRDPVPQGGVRLDHPCQKPLSAVRRAILASTRPGDAILDPFAGTCRVALACEQLHADQARRHISIEMDPGHVAAALQDIDARTRQQPLF